MKTYRRRFNRHPQRKAAEKQTKFTFACNLILDFHNVEINAKRILHEHEAEGKESNNWTLQRDPLITLRKCKVS